MRALGIDFGEARIGLALGDPDGRIATPFATLERATDRIAVGRIRDLARRERVEVLVLGDPVRLDGSPGDLSARVRRFAAKLRKSTRLPVHLVPETLTSVEAERRLAAAGAAVGRDDKGRLDAVAAQILLEDFFAGAGAPLTE